MPSTEYNANLGPIIKQVFRPGLAAAWPICLGYLPIGLAFGVLAQKAGLNVYQIALMSVFVFAGSSQFIAVSMMANSASILAIVGTTFVVNLRHLLMGSSLAALLHREKRWKLSLFAYGVTDESFAVNYTGLVTGNLNFNQALVVNHASNFVWVAGTTLGGVFGHLIPEHAMGIDYALVAMFICLLVFQLKHRLHLVTAAVAGILAVALSLIMPGNMYIVAASVVAAAGGVLLKHAAGWDHRHGDRRG
jgi:4-azaleucine resistance transporter AzlC